MLDTQTRVPYQCNFRNPGDRSHLVSVNARSQCKRVPCAASRMVLGPCGLHGKTVRSTPSLARCAIAAHLLALSKWPLGTLWTLRSHKRACFQWRFWDLELWCGRTGHAGRRGGQLRRQHQPGQLPEWRYGQPAVQWCRQGARRLDRQRRQQSHQLVSPPTGVANPNSHLNLNPILPNPHPGPNADLISSGALPSF